LDADRGRRRLPSHARRLVTLDLTMDQVTPNGQHDQKREHDLTLRKPSIES